MMGGELCFFVSDLHGRIHRYEALFAAIRVELPNIVFLGGDLLPFYGMLSNEWNGDFMREFLIPKFKQLRLELGEKYPAVFVIFGNDDPAFMEDAVVEGEAQELWTYLHNRKVAQGALRFYGYSFVPPSPFRFKDWEKYDVSRYVDPGCIDPLEGSRSVPIVESELKFSTIEKDLKLLTGTEDLSNAIFLFHTPPYNTHLDRASLDGKMIDSAPLDVHVGSIAVRRFIQARGPLLSLHGHIHESARITGSWKDRIGSTWMFSAAHDGPELALVRFNTDDLEHATRELL